MTRKLNELRLSVGTTPDVFPQTAAKHNSLSNAISKSADSMFSSHMSKTFTDEDKFSEDEEMEDSILRKRVKIGGAYNLDKTLERIDEFLDVGDLAGDAFSAISKGGKGIKKIASNALKSAVGSIPVVDVIFGSYRLASLAETIRKFSESLSEKMNKPKGYFGDALKADNDNDWKQLMYDYATLTKTDKKAEDELLDLFNNVLENLKDFVITLIESYDTIAAALASGVSGFTLALPAIGGANIGTGIAGFATRSIPFERVLFSGTGYIAEGLKTILDIFLGNSAHSQTIEEIGEEGSISKLKSSLREVEEKGGSLMSAFLFSPVETLGRLNEFYRATGDPSLYLKAFEKVVSEDKKYSILFLLESVEKDDSLEEEFHEINLETLEDEVDISEFSGAGAVGGYVTSLGPNPNKPSTKKAQTAHHRLFEKEKEINEQRERIALLQAFHQKTTNNIK